MMLTSGVGVLLGFLEKEIRKDGIPMLDTGENPDAPAPREMIDLEVVPLTLYHHSKGAIISIIKHAIKLAIKLKT